MRIAIVTDAFPPMRTSGAVQLRDLAREFVRLGHEPVVLVASPGIDQSWKLDAMDGHQVLRLRSPRTKDIGYARRTMGEFEMPFAMRRNFRRSPLAGTRWDGVVWYSPTIFLGPFVQALKQASAS